MSRQTWSEPFESKLRAYLPLLSADKELTSDLSLADHGLDSLATVSLLLDLEDAFAVMIPDHLLSVDTFATPAGLWEVIDSLRDREAAK
ncbi:phosphopantetheine-binding protein [Nocardia goodfellowii]|uniref:Acyl carrier protein n=1 Tax=Nocardia goodfellowii TaxID=882446 RepID=A0ABS4QF19_9NOCA|nr:phosphopantetheine-binding protein [Nocardia goodfellowii]MBP2189684.1 acyl carrier protein [Nocardia goodfellowii]